VCSLVGRLTALPPAMISWRPCSAYESIAKLARQEIKAGGPSALPPDSLVQSVYFDKS